MLFCLKKKKSKRSLNHRPRQPSVYLFLPFTFILVISISLYKYGSYTVSPSSNQLSTPIYELSNKTIAIAEKPSPRKTSPYHDWQLFNTDFKDMMQNFKIFVYDDNQIGNSFSHIFLPHDNPYNPKLGNYFSEHIFKIALLNSSLITQKPEEAHMFFLPFSINNLRNDPRVHSEEKISEFVAEYTNRVTRELPFFNSSGGADHFYVCCHSVGVNAASKHYDLHNNAIQVTCSSSYFQRLYVTHKDVALPQVWPRLHQSTLTNPPHARERLAFYAGRVQNSRIREQLITLWGNDTDMDIFGGKSPFPYGEGFRKSKYCLHVRGYEVNTARVADAIYHGCVPVIVSNHYDLPFANVLDWSKFSVTINNRELVFLKRKLLSITDDDYLSMYYNLFKIQRHFMWHATPKGYDSFHMTAYQLWLKRSVRRLSILPSFGYT
ncbi:hypothetical protein ACFE04_014900 [Oxalis oulophora]